VYFGYSQIWRFTFVPVGCVVVLATFIALCLVYAVGASSGGHAAERYLAWTFRLFWVALVADLVWAVVSGQLAAFVTVLGWSPLIELGMLSFLCIGSMGFMAARYVEGKRDDSVSQVAATESSADIDRGSERA
jgi:hypothetical protein